MVSAARIAHAFHLDPVLVATERNEFTYAFRHAAYDVIRSDQEAAAQQK